MIVHSNIHSPAQRT